MSIWIVVGEEGGSEVNLRPLYQVGYMIAGDFGSPKILYAIFAEGTTSPDCRVKSPNP